MQRSWVPPKDKSLIFGARETVRALKDSSVPKNDIQTSLNMNIGIHNIHPKNVPNNYFGHKLSEITRNINRNPCDRWRMILHFFCILIYHYLILSWSRQDFTLIIKASICSLSLCSPIPSLMNTNRLDNIINEKQYTCIRPHRKDIWSDFQRDSKVWNPTETVSHTIEKTGDDGKS